eukprot:XP_011408107.2 PREDICTED: LOW QUALITY PROTEIN: uncharacterized protein LOC100634496 [Amphimedon queenslandica]
MAARIEASTTILKDSRRSRAAMTISHRRRKNAIRQDINTDHGERRMIDAKLEGKKVLVTGASSGIGLEAVRVFARCGARVALNHLPDDPRGAERIHELCAEGFDIVAAPGDVSAEKEAEAMVERAIESLGGLDILINNAGTANATKPIPFEDLEAMDEAFWQTILSTNLLGPFRCARSAAPQLKRSKGAIVNTASVAGLPLGVRGSSIAYSASKAALINLTRNLALGLGPDIRVNAVAPGLVDTPWTRPWPSERKQPLIERTMLSRMVQPEEIAEAMLFLAVHPAISGQTLAVDCGLV